MIGGTPMCMGCKHYDFKRHHQFCCVAFPKGIPITIILNTLDHNFPAPGDHGVHYESLGGTQYGLAARPELQPCT